MIRNNHRQIISYIERELPYGLTCWKARSSASPFVINTNDPETIGQGAVIGAGISGAGIRDIMLVRPSNATAFTSTLCPMRRRCYSMVRELQRKSPALGAQDALTA